MLGAVSGSLTIDFFLIAACYCLGCFTSGYYWVRWRTGQDVRQLGSGSVGARNVGRVLGGSGFIVVLLLDFTKGALAVWLATKLGVVPEVTVMSMAAVVVGHTWPAQLRFHGGKGVAVAAGVFAVLAPAATIAASAVFFATAGLSRLISLGSMAATVTLPSAAWLTGAPPAVVSAAFGSAALILFRHRANMRRILGGTERRFGAPR